MPSPDEATQQTSTGIPVPINLVRQTIVYLESHSDPMAMMLKQHYKSWLKMSLKQQKVHRMVATQVNGQYFLVNYEIRIFGVLEG